MPGDRDVVGAYRLLQTLGQGSFGKVKKAMHIETKEEYAIKIIEKKRLNRKAQEKINREIRILRMLRHPFIVRLYEIIDTPRCIYLVMEYVVGGELFDYIVAHQRVKEREARIFFSQILMGVEYCHSKNVIHRDLKPENLLIDSNHNIKIIDFGLSNVLDPDAFLKSKCGSPHYTAPEVTERMNYGAEADVFSLGVILFALLCGYLPFDDPNHEIIARDIRAENFEMPNHVSRNAASLIRAMLRADAKKRITVPEIKKQPWLELARFKLPALQPDPPIFRRRLSSVLESDVEEAVKEKDEKKGRKKFSPLPRSLVSAIHRVIGTKDSQQTESIDSVTDSEPRTPVLSVEPPREGLNPASPTLPPLPEGEVAELPSSRASSVRFKVSAATDQRRHSAVSTVSDSPVARPAPFSAKRKASLVDARRTSLPVLVVAPPSSPAEKLSSTLGTGRLRGDRSVSPTPPSPVFRAPSPRNNVVPYDTRQRRQSVAWMPGQAQTGAVGGIGRRSSTASQKRLLQLKEDAAADRGVPPVGADMSAPVVTVGDDTSLSIPIPNARRGRRASVAVSDWATGERMQAQAKQKEEEMGRGLAAGNTPDGITAPAQPAKPTDDKDNGTSVYHPRSGAFNRSATSSKPPGEIVKDLESVLASAGVEYKRKTDWRFKCKFWSSEEAARLAKQVHIEPDMRFEMEVFKLPRLPLHVVIYRRVQGNTWAHKDNCSKLLAALHL